MSGVFSKKWVWAALAAIVLAACVLAASAPAYAYNYTVRVWGGNVGLVNGKAYDEITVSKGTVVNLSNEFKVTIKKEQKYEKYEMKGFRPGGADNQERVDENDNSSNGVSNLRVAVEVNEDRDFVVAYRVKGEPTNYTIYFKDRRTGRDLADPVTHEGVVGDKRVVAFQEIEGYTPEYYNIAQTLRKGDNEYIFYYNSNTPNTTPSSSTTGGNTQGGGANQGGANQGGATTGGATTGGADQGGAAAGAQSTTAQGANQGEGATTTPPRTEEILDMDTPLAQQPTSSSSSGSGGSSGTDTTPADQQPGLPVAAIIGIAVALAAAIGLVFVLLKRRQEREMMQ